MCHQLTVKGMDLSVEECEIFWQISWFILSGLIKTSSKNYPSKKDNLDMCTISMLHTELVLLILVSINSCFVALVSDISGSGSISVCVSQSNSLFLILVMPIYEDYAYIHTLSPFGPGSPGRPTYYSKKNKIIFVLAFILNYSY